MAVYILFSCVKWFAPAGGLRAGAGEGAASITVVRGLLSEPTATLSMGAIMSASVYGCFETRVS